MASTLRKIQSNLLIKWKNGEIYSSVQGESFVKRCIHWEISKCRVLIGPMRGKSIPGKTTRENKSSTTEMGDAKTINCHICLGKVGMLFACVCV